MEIKIDNSSDSVKELIDDIKKFKSIYDAGLIISAQIGPQAIASWTAFLIHINIISSTNDNNYGYSIFNALESLTWLGKIK